ncbi:MAG TPA: ABC transporter permease [Burkholderiaceae bacterium]|nr:ABC transporter permease [Burkholderiaceae bacterium]
MKPVVLLTDGFVFALLVAGLAYVLHVRGRPQLAANWRLTLRRPAAAVSALILAAFLAVAVADSLHWRVALPAASAGQPAWSPETRSALDAVLGPLAVTRERTYSSPLAYQGFRKESFERNGTPVRDYPRLKFGGAHLKDPSTQWGDDVQNLAWRGVGWGALAWAVLALLSWVALSLRRQRAFGRALTDLVLGRTRYPVRSVLLAAAVLAVSVGLVASLSSGYHVFGTDRVGASVLVAALKSVRTALVIGALTTLVVLPLALALGVAAGYFRGWVDEVIQYIYTLLASIPDVLLIAAAVLLLQVKIDSNPTLFETSLERADARLFFLCLILGVTSFTGLCRLVRGETMKLRELEYIQAAQAFGVPAARILVRHILPNIVPIVLITTVMQFSAFVLAEAVLSYVGVGVDPKTASFGVMINTARLELSATPVIWWTLAAAFSFMFLIVLSANLFADAVRDAFDPRTRLRS